MATINGTNNGDNLNGTDLADQIFGLGGNDILIGFDGDDVLDGGKGADQLFGSSGFDMASYRNSAAGVQVYLLQSYAGGGDATGDHLYSIEGLIGSAFADGFVGDDQRNVLRGEGGADVLNGLGGNDTLDGGAGNDTADGGDGNDRINGGGGNDSLLGGGGNDRLDGGDGNDVLSGGIGDDELRGGAGVDTAIFQGYGVLVDLATGSAYQSFQGEPIGTDHLLSIENVTGSEEGDLIGGNGQANVLAGRQGSDVLAGRGGADRFVYYQPSDSAPTAPDEIVDFSRGQGDRIDLSAIDANAQVNGNQAFKFIGQGEFTGAGQLRFHQTQGHFYIEANTTDATPGAELVIEVNTSVQAGDFLL